MDREKQLSQIRVGKKPTNIETIKYIPRLGITFDMPKENEQFEYFGYGPMETYCDKKNAALVDRYSSTVTENFEHYIRPQENSSHFGTKWVVVGEELGYGLFMSGYGLDGVSFNVSHYTLDHLDKTAHDYELEPVEQTVVCLDYRHEGIGSGSCGPIASKPREIFPTRLWQTTIMQAMRAL